MIISASFENPSISPDRDRTWTSGPSCRRGWWRRWCSWAPVCPQRTVKHPDADDRGERAALRPPDGHTWQRQDRKYTSHTGNYINNTTSLSKDHTASGNLWCPWRNFHPSHSPAGSGTHPPVTGNIEPIPPGPQKEPSAWWWTSFCRLTDRWTQKIISKQLTFSLEHLFV